MRFPPSFLEDIKARVPVSEVVRSRVKLTKAGREWKGLSPFNAERTPSFFVNDRKMAWFDHSAGKNGNIFDFLMETEGLSFPEAVERLAALAGLPLPTASPEAEARERQRDSLHEVLEAAASYFGAVLGSPAGNKARAYMAGRGIAQDLQAQFRLGYAPDDKYGLRDHLAAKGFAREAMIEAGLLIHGEGIAVPYDRFRDRVMFPIADRSGRIIAFGGRALAKDVQAKYLNSPETPLFHKGAVLYNHHKARKAAHETGSVVVVVEGYVDVIAMAAAGFSAAVAPLGTALTPDQCELLWAMSEQPVLCFDGDRAGRKAAYRAIDMVLPMLGPGRSLNFALLPEGQDPDDLIRSGGRAAMEAVLASALPLVELLFRRETEAGPFTTPERRAALERRLMALAREIRDETLRRYYEAEFRTRLEAFLGPAAAMGPQRKAAKPWRMNMTAGRARLGETQRPMGQRPMKTQMSAPMVSASLAKSPLFRRAQEGLLPRDGLILLLLLNHPGLIEVHAEAIAEIELSGAADGLRRLILDFAMTGRSQADALRAAAESAGFMPILRQLEGMAAHASHWYAKAEAADADAEEVLKQALTLHRRARALHKELQLAEMALGNEASEVNLGRLNDIRDQLSALGGTEASIESFGQLSGRPVKLY
jgi:DNA primase